MKKTTIRLDEPIHTVLARIAATRGVSLNHLINYALVRFVSFEEAFEMLEARAQHAQPGAMRRVLARTTAPALPPQDPEDELPPQFNRAVLEQRLAHETALHTNHL